MNQSIEIFNFLEKFSERDLVRCGVLRRHKLYGYLLQGVSVYPLITLMKKFDITTLLYGELWSLSIDGMFQNGWAGYSRTTHVSDLSHLGDVFRSANEHINPFYENKNQNLLQSLDSGSAEAPLNANIADVKIKPSEVSSQQTPQHGTGISGIFNKLLKPKPAKPSEVNTSEISPHIENIEEFLGKFSARDLHNREVLNSHKRFQYLLQGSSVLPLIRLMRENRIIKLEYYSQWSLDQNGMFHNSWAGYSRLTDVRTIDHPGDVFKNANEKINPYYNKW